MIGNVHDSDHFCTFLMEKISFCYSDPPGCFQNGFLDTSLDVLNCPFRKSVEDVCRRRTVKRAFYKLDMKVVMFRKDSLLQYSLLQS